LIVPLPLPLALPVTVSHPAELVAVQAQPLAVAIVAVPVDAVLGTVCELGVSSYEQEPLWFRVKVAEPAVIVADRTSDPELALTL
jgi:hypothetical protein